MSDWWHEGPFIIFLGEVNNARPYSYVCTGP
ncbi:MAG: hypothetical protein JWM42_144, partial [Burkholderia sp.]|nr:hypothetical protein [Burkholderia sp.]